MRSGLTASHQCERDNRSAAWRVSVSNRPWLSQRHLIISYLQSAAQLVRSCSRTAEPAPELALEPRFRDLSELARKSGACSRTCSGTCSGSCSGTTRKLTPHLAPEPAPELAPELLRNDLLRSAPQSLLAEDTCFAVGEKYTWFRSPNWNQISVSRHNSEALGYRAALAFRIAWPSLRWKI